MTLQESAHYATSEAAEFLQRESHWRRLFVACMDAQTPFELWKAMIEDKELALIAMSYLPILVFNFQPPEHPVIKFPTPEKPLSKTKIKKRLGEAVAKRKERVRELEASRARAQELAIKTVKKVESLFDTLKLPDGRLFADVPRYEYGELKRTFRSWIKIIDSIEKHSKAAKDDMTARQTIRPEVLEKIVKDAWSAA